MAATSGADVLKWPLWVFSCRYDLVAGWAFTQVVNGWSLPFAVILINPSQGSYRY